MLSKYRVKLTSAFCALAADNNGYYYAVDGTHCRIFIYDTACNVMSVFGGGQLIKDFGSPEGVKKEFDYLRKVVKSLGYDDLIILCCGGADATMKACGFDGAHAYNWSKAGSDVEITLPITEAYGAEKLTIVSKEGINAVDFTDVEESN